MIHHEEPEKRERLPYGQEVFVTFGAARYCYATRLYSRLYVAANCQWNVSRWRNHRSFSPITSLMYVAFQLTLKAYCLHDHRPIKEYKNLMELVELNSHLGLSTNDIFLLKTLSRQQVFNKGVDYDLWENQQQLHVFCEEIISLYERVQSMMPLELQSDYQE